MECEHFVQKTPDILPNTKGCQECEVEKTPMGCNSNVSYVWSCRVL